ncbi:sigma-70 family RNA polymerase sigma factor [Actinoplanes sp. NPDC051475]|uniref:RNA polymerase sigma factor n=1 Tax=Actinoplanes sp. NPDC051475 TaxID=3157225 RepID=UPI00344EC6E8
MSDRTDDRQQRLPAFVGRALVAAPGSAEHHAVWAELIDEALRDKAYAIGRSKVRKPEFLDVAWSEAAIKAMRCLPKLEKPASFDQWFCAIFVREARAASKRETDVANRRVPLPEDDAADPGPIREASAEERAVDREHLDRLTVRALRRLTGTERRALLVSVETGLEGMELAMELSHRGPHPVSQGSVYVCLSRARAKLRGPLAAACLVARRAGCRDLDELLGSATSRPLPDKLMDAVEDHARRCRRCRAGLLQFPPTLTERTEALQLIAEHSGIPLHSAPAAPATGWLAPSPGAATPVRALHYGWKAAVAATATAGVVAYAALGAPTHHSTAAGPVPSVAPLVGIATSTAPSSVVTAPGSPTAASGASAATSSTSKGSAATPFMSTAARPRPARSGPYVYAAMMSNVEVVPYAPMDGYSVSSRGGGVSMRTEGVGHYVVRFAGMQDQQPSTRSGAVWLVNQPPGPPPKAYCQVGDFQSGSDAEEVDVRCFAPTGERADGQFSLAYTRDGRLNYARRDATAAWLVRRPDGSSNAYNSTGAGNSVRQVGVGRYSVTFGAVGGPTDAKDFQLTPLGTRAATCTLQWPPGGTTDMVLEVGCTVLAGTPIDTGFVLGHSRP